MTASESTTHLPGRARALLAAAREARTEEGVAGLMTAVELAALRDERANTVLGTSSLAALIARDIPSLDRRSLKSLLAVANAFGASPELERLADFGLTRLALAARAPEDVREGLLSGPMLPLREMRRAAREAQGTVAAERLRSGATPANAFGAELTPRGPEPAGPLSEREARAQALLDAAARHWRETSSASFTLARRLTEIARLAGGSGETSASGFALNQAGFDAEELERSTALVDTFGLLPLARREAVGIGGLRAVAAIEDPTVRAALVARLRQEDLAGDAVLAAARVGRPLAPEMTPPEDAPGHWVDDPERLAPFNLLYLADFDDAGFEEATPPDLVEQILLRASRPGDLVCDLMAGSGTVARVATPMDRLVSSVDILNPPISSDIAIGDARDVVPTGAPFSLVILHPPVPLDVLYSERYAGKALPGDLSPLEPESYQRAMRDILEHAATLLRPRGRLVLVCRESYFKGRLIDWPARFERLAQGVDLVLEERLHAALGPKTRAAIAARSGFIARRERRAIPVVLSVLFFARKAREESSFRMESRR